LRVPAFRAVFRFAVDFFAAVFRFAVDFLAVERLAVDLRAVVFRFAVDFFAAVFRFAVDFLAVDLRAVFRFAVDFFAVDLRAVVFRFAVDFLAVDLRAVVFRFAVDFLAVERLAVDLRAVVFFAAVFFLAPVFLAVDFFFAVDFFRAPVLRVDPERELLEERDDERVVAGTAIARSASALSVASPIADSPHACSASAAGSFHEPALDVFDASPVPLQSSWVMYDLLSRIARARSLPRWFLTCNADSMTSPARCLKRKTRAASGARATRASTYARCARTARSNFAVDASTWEHASRVRLA
jgi:hypothetical protein